MRRSTCGLRAMLQSTRGAALVLVAAAMFAIAASAAIAVDIGMLTWTRVQSQRTADAAALAGAGWLLLAPTDEAGARARAKEYAWLNPVRGDSVVLLDEDIDVILDSAKVRVRVNNVVSRGTGVATFFARVLGITHVDVRTLAAAWAAPVNGVDETQFNVQCLLPIILLDEWHDADGDGEYDIGESYSTEGTSFGSYDVGMLIGIKVSGSQDTGGPQACRTESDEVDLDMCRDIADSDNWRCWWKDDPNADGGAGELGARIYPGEDCTSTLAIDDQVWTADAGGNKQSLINTTHEDFGGTCNEVCYDYDGDGINETCQTYCPNGSFGDLIRADSVFLGIRLEWCDTCTYSETQTDPPGCPVVAWSIDGDPPVDGTTCYTGDSYRIRTVPLASPTLVTGTGAGINTYITDFTGVFVDNIACNYDLPMFKQSNGNLNVYVRIMNTDQLGGQVGGDPGPGPAGTTVKRLQLIE